MIRPRRVAIRLIGRFACYLIVANGLLSVPHAFHGADAESSAQRSLRFPADRTVGTAFWRMPDGKPFLYASYGDAWKPVATSRGIVRVPAEAQVRLDVGKAASSDLAWLDDLRPDDIQALNLSGSDVSDEGLRHITRLTGLRGLYLQGAPISDAGLQGFNVLTNLEEIDLGTFGEDGTAFAVGDGAIHVLGRLPKLRRLGLWSTRVTASGLAELVNCRSLTHLELGGTNVSDGGLGELVECRSLTYLRLDDTKVSDAGLIHLANMPQLETLWLGGNDGVSDEGLKTVGKLVNLTRLDLSRTKITGQGLAQLRELKKLKTLLLDSTGVGESDLVYLEPLESLEAIRLYDTKGSMTDVAAEHLARLRSLREVSGNLYFTDKGVALLARLPHLEQLLLDGDGVTDACAGDIARMESLKRLWFQGCPVTDAMLQRIAGLPNLQELLLSRARVSGDGFRNLREAARLSILNVYFDRAGDRKLADQPRPHLREIGKLHQIKELRIEGDSLVDGDLKDLAGLVNLESLDISIPVDDDGASALVGLQRLKSLQISHGVLTDVGLERVSLLPRLEFVGLEGRFTDDGLLHLARLDRLQRLWVASADITDAGLQELARRLPNLRSVQRRITANEGEEVVLSGKDKIRRDAEDRAVMEAMEDRPPPSLSVSGWLNAGAKGLDLKQLEGRVVLVDFWSTWCGPCRALMPELKGLHEKYADKGLQIVGIHTTQFADTLPEYVKHESIDWPMAADVDQATVHAWKVPHYPTLFLIDRSGKLRVAGLYRGDLERAIVQLLDEAAAAGNQVVPRRAAKKQPPDAASRAGRIYDTEPMPVSIEGTAKDHLGQPLRGVVVYVAVANGFGAFGRDAILAQATTNNAGKYVLKDVMLPVRTFPPQPDVVEGKFQVFGVSDDHGFAWHGVRAYRPRPRPSGDSEPEMDHAFYEGEAITNDLLFGPTVPFAGQVRDDLGNAIAGAKVQIGVIDDRRRAGSKTWRFELLAAEDRLADRDRAFDCVAGMPDSHLSATTDAFGRYQIPHVPRDASFLAAVSAKPELGSLTAAVTTSDKTIEGAESAVASGWNPVLVAPRAVAIRTIDEADKVPLERVVLHAYGQQFRGSGSEARSDYEGRAVLQLPPGHYRLVAEPAIGSAYVRTEQQIDVDKEPIEQVIELGVRPGGLVLLKVLTEDSQPVEGVGFTYETDSSRDTRELQSQTVFVDHARTDRDGVLRAVIEPGRRRFFISTVPDGYEATDGENPWIEVDAGREVTVHFKLRKKPPPTDAADMLADGADLQRRLQDLWRRQNDFKFKGTITYRMTFRPADEHVVTRDEIRDVIAAFDANAGTDIASWINQHLPELSVRLAGPYQMVVDGQRHRRTAAGSSKAGEQATSIEAFNGAEIVRYDAANAQVSVDDRRVSFVHIDGVNDLRRWPFVPRRTREKQQHFDVMSRFEGRTVLKWQSGATAGRLVVDEETGFVYEASRDPQADGNGNDEFQFAPIELAGGMIWPRIRVDLYYRRGELYTLGIHDIYSIEPHSELPPDAFVVSVPAGTLVLASEFGAAVSDSRGDQPRSPKLGMATGPVTDAVQFAYSLSPKTRVLWPVLTIGQDAPALEAAAWLTRDGEIDAPDLRQKVVLVDFWGQGCGPCVAELPKLVNLAKQYENTDLRIVGWHESSGDVEDLAQFARKHGLPYTLAIDHEADEPGWFGALFKSFGVRGIPQSALLDRQGKVLFVGTLTEAISQLESVVGKAGEQEPAP